MNSKKMKTRTKNSTPYMVSKYSKASKVYPAYSAVNISLQECPYTTHAHMIVDHKRCTYMPLLILRIRSQCPTIINIKGQTISPCLELYNYTQVPDLCFIWPGRLLYNIKGQTVSPCLELYNYNQVPDLCFIWSGRLLYNIL